MKANPLNPHQLVEVHTYTDYQSGSIIRNIPVLFDGSIDPMRTEVFLGTCMLNSPRGPMNFNFPINAKSLFEAIENFPAALEAAMADLQDQELRKKLVSNVGNRLDLSKLNNKN